MSGDIWKGASALLARLSTADGPDQKLDEAIERWKHGIDGEPGRILLPFGHVRYTLEIDCALRLVPSGYAVAMVTSPPTASCEKLQRTRIDDHWYESALHYDASRGANLAIAVCIAALKAVQAQQDGL